jgi:alanine racemase
VSEARAYNPAANLSASFAALALLTPLAEEKEAAVRPAWLEMDLEAFRANVAYFRGLCGLRTEVCAVVKGNAYGHGAVPISRAALRAGASVLAVAIGSEARELRDAGLSAPILILGDCGCEDPGEVLDTGAIPAVAMIESAECLSAAAAARSAVADVHIKIDSGMGRWGVRWDEIGPFAERFRQLPGVRAAGMFTHFAIAEAESDFTRWQYGNFLAACAQTESVLGPVPVKHCCNTAAAVYYPDMHLSMIRPGAGIYGINPGLPSESAACIRPALSLHSRIGLTKHLHPGDSAGYGRIFRAAVETRLALVPLGYCDGYPRSLSGNADALVRGRRVPIVGRISMDVMILDVTAAGDVRVGEDVVLVGCQGDERIGVEELATRAGTTVQEIVSRFGPRLPRVYLNE